MGTKFYLTKYQTQWLVSYKITHINAKNEIITFSVFTYTKSKQSNNDKHELFT